MPELPEIETVRRCVGPMLIGRRVESVNVRCSKLIAHPSENGFAESLVGRRVESVGRRGKFLVWILDSGAHVDIHFRMSGQMTVSPPERPEMRWTRLEITLNDGCVLRYADQRRFGRMWLFEDGEEDTSGINALGPEPDDSAVDWRYLKGMLGNRRMALKSALLDQSVVAGLGNIYTDESLFGARINPLTPCCEVTTPQWKRLATQIPRIVSRAISENAMSPEQYLESEGRGYRSSDCLQAYGHGGLPCVRCGTPMIRSVVGGRSACWCPRCQPPKLHRTPAFGRAGRL